MGDDGSRSLAHTTVHDVARDAGLATSMLDRDPHAHLWATLRQLDRIVADEAARLTHDRVEFGGGSVRWPERIDQLYQCTLTE